MRIGYSDEEDYPGQFGLWRGNCQRSLKGRKGQVALRELEAALLALPEKRLIAQELVDDEGSVCAIGAVARQRGRLDDHMRTRGEYDMEDVGVQLGMPRLVAWKIVEMNDVILEGFDLVFDLPGPWRWPGEQPYMRIPITPETRYERMLEWVQSQITR